MRRLQFLSTHRAWFTVFVIAVGCAEQSVPRTPALSPEKSAAKSESDVQPAEFDQNASSAVATSTQDGSLSEAQARRGAGTAAGRAEEIVELLESAKYKSQTEDSAGADQDYLQAGELAERLLDLRSELTRKELRITAIASYLQARALARSSEPQQALTAIERAFAAGFEDLERLDQDAELSLVRALPEFDAFRAAHETRLAAETRNEIQRQIESFAPYPLEFRLPNLDETEVASTEFRGKVVVLAFWGTWCIKCQAEVPALNRLQTAYGERGVQVIGLSYEEAEDNAAAVERIRKFQESNPVEYLCLLGDEATRDQVQPPDDGPPEWVFPVTLILDQQGRVRLHFTGEVSYRRLEAAVQSLLESEPADHE